MEEINIKVPGLSFRDNLLVTISEDGDLYLSNPDSWNICMDDEHDCYTSIDEKQMKKLIIILQDFLKKKEEKKC